MSLHPWKNRRAFLRQTTAEAVVLGALAQGALSAATEDKRPRIKVGQIGTRHSHAAGKMETIRRLDPLYEVVGLVEPDAALRPRIAEQKVYADLPLLAEEQLLATPGLQAVVVETDMDQLTPTARRCVAAGMHVHVDKPPGESLADFAALLDEATARRRVVQVGYMLRYNPAFVLLREALRAGWLGDVFEVHGVMSKRVADRDRGELARLPGGTMYELGCHLVDAVIGVLGAPQKVTAFNRRTRPDLDTLWDNQLAVFEYPQATATVRSSVVEPHGGVRRQFVVCGTKGVIDIRPLEPPVLRLALEEPRGSYRAGYQEVELSPLAGRYDGDFIDLAAVIRGDHPFHFTPEHDLAVHRSVLAASGLA